MKYNIKMRSWISGVTLLALLILVGCIPKRVVWSPDGQQAAVLGDDGLYLCDTNGKLTGLLVPKVQSVQWFADSKRLALAREITCSNWSEAQPLLEADESAKISARASMALNQFKAGKHFPQVSATLTNFDTNERNAVVLCLKGLEGAKAASGNDWDSIIKPMELEIFLVQVGTVSDGKIKLGPALAHDFGMVFDIRIAPGEKMLAFTSSQNNNDTSLKVVPLDGSAGASIVAEQVSLFSDWTTDGRSLVYVKAVGTSGSDDLQLGSLERRSVLTASGWLDVMGKPDPLAGMLFFPYSKVRCLNDGRIIFSAMDVHLPATAADMPRRQQLFALDPDKQATLTPLIPKSAEQDVPEDLSFFELSPDQTRVSILGDKGDVVIFNLAAGTVDKVQTGTDADVVSVPTWRSNDELCYIAYTPTNNAGEVGQVALYAKGRSRTISGGWPKEVRQKFLDK